MNYPAFFDELEKLSYGVADINRVLALSKKRAIKVGRNSNLGQMGALSFPKAVSNASSKAVHGAVQAGSLPASAAQHTDRFLSQVGGKMTVPGRTGGTVGHVRKMMDPLPFPSAQRASAATAMSGKSRKASESIMRGHELDELQLGRKAMDQAFISRFGHVSPDVILRERNRLVTLPSGQRRGPKKLFGALRDFQGEAPLFERATRGVSGKGMKYTQGQRLSRHARKRVSNRMSQLLEQDVAGGGPATIMDALQRRADKLGLG